MIHTLLLDELRTQVAEDAARGQFKKPPDSAEERLEQLMSRFIRTQGGRGGMSLSRARQMASDAEIFDAQVAKGIVD